MTRPSSYEDSNKMEKFFAPSNLLKELIELREDWVARTKKIRRDYSYINSDYFNT